jgi:paraquat-inducible protein B
MSEYDEPAHDRREADHAPEAEIQAAKWSPWIWVVPVVAIFFAGWLVVRYGFFGGGDITVRFAEARGLDRYSPVRFRGAKVGTVQKITIDEELKEVLVRISMDASMNHALNKGTRFWIVEPGLEGGGLGGLLSGTYVGIAPGEGEETREFVGQEYPPVLAAPEPGKTFILEGQGAGSISVGSPVLFQGTRVGRVLGSEYDQARGVTSVHVFVVNRFAGHVRQATRFWRAGGLSVSFGGGGLSMGDSSLSSLLTAPVAFYTPEVLAGAPVREGTHFELHESRDAAIAASDGPHLTYLTYFPGPLHGLRAGTPVQMKGVQVGRVRDVRLRYVATSGSLETPVMLEIDPRLLEFEISPATTREDLRRRMNDALQSLVRKGMRATLSSSLVLPGASAVSLENVAAPNTGNLNLASNPPIIPAAAAGGGIEGALASLNDVAGTIRNLPLREIANSMRSAAARADALLGDPILNESLRRLNSSLTEIEKAARTTNQNIEPIAESLRNAATSAEAAAKRVEQLVGTSQRQNYDIAELIRELTRAAEAVRALASYLTENPDAVLKGRRE